MARAVQARGFAVGLHSAGIYPQRLAQLLPWLDWLALDIKTDQAGYDALTGRARSAWPVQVCLEMALEAGCALECRTTWSPQRLSEARLLALAQTLAARGVRHYAVQDERSAPGLPAQGALSEAAQAQLARSFASFSYRRS